MDKKIKKNDKSKEENKEKIVDENEEEKEEKIEPRHEISEIPFEVESVTERKAPVLE